MDGVCEMIVLGMLIEWSLKQAKVFIRIDVEKAAAWKAALMEAMQSGTMIGYQCAKVAGRA